MYASQGGRHFVAAGRTGLVDFMMAWEVEFVYHEGSRRSTKERNKRSLHYARLRSAPVGMTEFHFRERSD